MCRGPHPTRRHVLGCMAAAAVPALSGCDAPVQIVSDEKVEAMGLRAWAEIRSSSPLGRNPDYQAALDRVSARLLSARGEVPGDWEVLVFGRPEVNAFALPGRKIGVFEGMFGVVGSLDQLAAIVGHEIGHLQAEHSQERINAQLTAEWGLEILAFLMALGGIDYAREIAAALGVGVEYGLVLPYSRRQELEADRLGLETMAIAGFEPAEAVELWRRMEVAAGPRLPEFLATHPAPASRIQAIEEMLPQIRRG